MLMAILSCIHIFFQRNNTTRRILNILPIIAMRVGEKLKFTCITEPAGLTRPRTFAACFQNFEISWLSNMDAFLFSTGRLFRSTHLSTETLLWQIQREALLAESILKCSYWPILVVMPI